MKEGSYEINTVFTKRDNEMVSPLKTKHEDVKSPPNITKSLRIMMTTITQLPSSFLPPRSELYIQEQNHQKH